MEEDLKQMEDDLKIKDLKIKIERQPQNETKKY